MKTKGLTGIIFILFSMLFYAPLLSEGREGIIVPGDVSRICYYTGFFYNYPTEDFMYYLNDRLLFSEKPDGVILDKGLRDKLLEVVSWHQIIREFLFNQTQGKLDSVTFNLKNFGEYRQAEDLLNLLGQKLGMNRKGQYYLDRKQSAGIANYLQFALIRPRALEQQMNRTQSIHFHLKESRISIPWDLEFIREVSGVNVDDLSFFEALLKNEQLSLLIGLLYRLSDNEIKYIDNLIQSPRFGAWKQIYNNKKLLMGLFVLSNALRVKPGENRLALPGGKSAEAFWSEMAGDQSKSLNPNSFEFLEALAAKDDGKLNYLYLFSYFLSNDAVKALFFDFDVQKMKEIYQLISLNDEEKINDSTFPRLDDWSYFTLIYALKTKNGAIDFPHGAPAWFEAMKGEKNETAVPFDVIKELLAHPGNGDKTKELRKFMSLYTKFYHRPQLLAGGGLSKLYTHYQKYNGLVDFMEKIPLKKPETLVQLLDWVQTLESLDKKDERLFTTIYQSLFELLSFTGKYAPFAFDYDHLVSELIKLPTDKAKFYRGLFQFFKKNMGIEGKNKTLTDAILIGIKNPTLKIVNSRYIYLIKDKFKESLNEILKSQEVCAFSTLLEIDRLLEQGLKAKSSGGSGIGSRIIDIFHLLPHPGISADAPRNIRHRVVSYSPSKLNKAVKGLALKIRTGSSKEELMDAIDKIKGDYLIWQLKDHLLALAYAVNAKDANLKAFLNPNLVRLHDIDGSKGVTSWNNWGKEEKHRFFSEYHLSGGLSRLNITLTSKWKDHLFKNNIVYNVPLVQAVIQNLLDFYPLPLVNHSLTYTGLLVQLGMDLIHYAGEDEVDDENTTAKETVKKVLMEEIGRITSGYHYRRFMDYLNGKSDNHNLFFSEIKDLGEAFLHHPGIQKVENIGEISTFGKLEAFQKPPVSDELKKEMHWFGSIYSQTFGNLRPQEFAIFPQEVASLFSSGWLSGARVEEFKVKVAYHLYKKKIPPDLLGQLLYMYLRTTCGKFLRQNHFNDYSAVYLIFTIFNTSHLNQQIKKLKKEGYLKLK